jgi:membrane protein
LRLFRRALWRSVENDQFTAARAAAYYSILTLFPALMVTAYVLASSERTAGILREIAGGIGEILPPGNKQAAMAYFEQHQRPLFEIISASGITLFAASGALVSWMDGFVRTCRVPNTWGGVKQRIIACGLVLLTFVPLMFATVLVAFGNQIETAMMDYTLHNNIREFGPVIILSWTALRWLIATITCVGVLSLIYHLGVPCRQRWHQVLPGSVLATLLWLLSTELFGWYVATFATYNLIYGPLGAAIALLVWMYMTSFIVLLGAEFNAVAFPLEAVVVPVPEPVKVIP